MLEKINKSGVVDYLRVSPSPLDFHGEIHRRYYNRRYYKNNRRLSKVTIHNKERQLQIKRTGFSNWLG
jgi:hypothetical protein